MNIYHCLSIHCVILVLGGKENIPAFAINIDHENPYQYLMIFWFVCWIISYSFGRCLCVFSIFPRLHMILHSCILWLLVLLLIVWDIIIAHRQCFFELKKERVSCVAFSFRRIHWTLDWNQHAQLTFEGVESDAVNMRSNNTYWKRTSNICVFRVVSLIIHIWVQKKWRNKKWNNETLKWTSRSRGNPYPNRPLQLSIQ